MSESATITVTLTPQMAGHLSGHLAAIAARERGTPDAVAAAAVADLLARDDATLAAVARGRADAAADRIVPQADVMRDVRAIIDAARAAR